MASWIQESLLAWNEKGKCYQARWTGGISVPFLPPGYGPLTCQQALERFNGIIKGNLPVNAHTLCLSAVSPEVEASVRSQMCAILSCEQNCCVIVCLMSVMCILYSLILFSDVIGINLMLKTKTLLTYGTQHLDGCYKLLKISLLVPEDKFRKISFRRLVTESVPISYGIQR